jgi:hypothetical protein
VDTGNWIALIAAAAAVLTVVIMYITIERQRRADAEAAAEERGGIKVTQRRIDESLDSSHTKIRALEDRMTTAERSYAVIETVIESGISGIRELIEAKFEGIGRELKDLKEEVHDHVRQAK